MIPTLEDDYRTLQSQTGHYAGYGRGPKVILPEYTDRQGFDLEACLRSGLRRFYSAHEWTFLKPTASIRIDADQQWVFLPDDWGGKDGTIAVTSDQGVILGPVRWQNQSAIDQEYAMFPAATGRPLMAIDEPVNNQGQYPRFKLRVFPAADQTYYLNFPYYIVPGALNVDRPYAYGGAVHAETRKAACIAAAELLLDGIKGPMEQEYQERVLESIRIDRRSEPRVLGYNGTNERGPYCRGNSAHRYGRTTLHVAGQTFN